jgi:hypothetical protein
MNEENLQKGIEEIRKISMTATEKNRIFESVINSPVPKPAKSPFQLSPYMAIWHEYKISKVLVALSLILLVSGGGLVFASSSSLPGTKLYAIKVGIVEPIQSAFTFSTVSKAAYESTLINKRLEEAEKLVEKGELDKEKESELNALVSGHTKKLDDNLTELRKQKNNKANDAIIKKFQKDLEDHSAVLDTLETPEDVRELPKKTEEERAWNKKHKDKKDLLNINISEDSHRESENEDN